ncbi:hypothetical protein F0Q45_15605 [Mycobacterium simiae]|uniref:Uncharacterized protein n=1 Tax=Mycobacterium simiae TaxID=1784 RepID=A0A5B1BPJ1_MYCSI|nr:hypothetical protein [Mycobacterium simiae]KAA1249340.1 hypothetical protein F0Q45_15605 [Mycobacterium simiae]
MNNKHNRGEGAAIDRLLWEPLNHRLRWPLVGLLVFVAAIHVAELEEHLREQPIIGVGFILLIIACLLIAMAAAVRDTATAYSVAAITGAVAIAGYVFVRTAPIFDLAQEAEAWLEPLGVTALVTESALIAVALRALTGRPKPG